MPFQKGQVSNPNGRPIGAKGKNAGLVKAQLKELNCDPIAELVAIAQDVNTELIFRIKIYLDLVNYIHPKLKTIELSGADGGPFQNKYTVEIVDAPKIVQGDSKEVVTQ